MKSTSILKAVTLSGFTLLIICFVSYRAGAFESFFSPEDNDQLVSNNFNVNESIMAIDTPIVKKDTSNIYYEMMSSSKSMVPMFKEEQKGGPIKVDKILTPQNDTLTKKSTTQKELDKKPLHKKSPTTMSSSKSAVIFTPKPSNDTSKKPK